MSAFPEALNPVRGGFVFVDPALGTVLKTVPFQYNPDTLTRTLTPQGIGKDPGDRLEALRLKGPAHEQYKFEAEFDATDDPARYPDGLYPVLSALEVSMYPPVSRLRHEDELARAGQIEVAPVESPLTVLVLGPKRVVPVQITEFSVTEEFFDQVLDPIRAKVAVGVRVLTVDDLGHQHHGGVLYLAYQGRKERFAQSVQNPISSVGTPRV